MRVGKKIRYYRKMYCLTQDDIGEACSVDRSTVANWEAGNRRPNYYYLKILSILFNVDLDVLDDDNISPIKLDNYKFIKHNIGKCFVNIENDDFLNINNYIEFSSTFSKDITFNSSLIEKITNTDITNKVFPKYNPFKHKVINPSIPASIYKMVMSIAMIISIVILIPFGLLKKDLSQSFIPDNIDEVVLTIEYERTSTTYNLTKIESSISNGVYKKYDFYDKNAKNLFIIESISIPSNYKNSDSLWIEHNICFISFTCNSDSFNGYIESIMTKTIMHSANHIKISKDYSKPYIETPGIYDIVFYTSNNLYYIGAFLNEF